MKNVTKLVLTVVALAVAGTMTAQAQTNSGSITATAVVQQPINVSGAVNLAFGNVFPGINKTIALTDAGAGRFDITGQASTNVNVSFTALPVNLTFGLNNLPIVFTAGSNTLNNAAGATGFTPSSGTSTALSGTGALFVFVGGTVSPASNLAAGTYTGTVTMQVLY